MMASTSSTRRVAAIIALLAAAGIVVGLALLVIRNALAVVIAIAALAVAGYAGWLAVTRRGLTRTVAAAAAAGALIGGIAALVASGATDELIVIAISFGVFAAAAPFALRHRDQLRHTARQGSPRRDKKILIVNPRSGDGVAARLNLAEQATQRGIEVVLLQPGDDLLELARRAVARADVVGMAGGDGSQALVAGVASEHDVAFVCIPAGTRNHFALDLGIDRQDVVGALDAFAWGVDRKVDLARVNGRTFVNNVSLGVYAEVVKSEEYRGAKIATARAMLPELLGPDAAPLPIRLSDPNGRPLDAVRVVLVSNNPYHLDGLMGVGVRAHLDTGQLGVLAIEIGDASDAAALVSLDTTGQIKRYRGWHEWSAAELIVEGEGGVAAGVDGESIELDAPLRFESLPGALRVRVVPWAEEGAPSATKTVSHDVLTNLWGVAAGDR